MSKIHNLLMPVTRPHDCDEVLLNDDFCYTCPKYKVHVDIKRGFIFDGASIPRVFWVTTGSPFSPQNIGPGLIHDYLYRYAKDTNGKRVPRKLADQVMEYALRMNRVSKWNRLKMYRALRTFGLFAWRKHRKRDK